MKLNPYRYQRIGTKTIIRHDGVALLADEMGLGKTLQALMYLKIKRGEALPAFVVCPKLLKFVWKREAERLGLSTLILAGRSAPKGGYPKVLPDLVIVNYDILAKHSAAPKKGPNKKRRKVVAIPTRHAVWLSENNFKTILADEAHYLKNPKAIRTLMVSALAAKLPHRIAITGTPVTNRPAELFPILHLLWPKRFSNWLKYATKYCNPRWTSYGWKYDGAVNMGQLHKRLRRYGMIRRLKKDVLSELPPLVRDVVPLPITREREYVRAETNFLEWISDTHGKKKAKRAARALSLTRIGYLKRLASECAMPSKVEWVKAFLEDNPGEKIVLFAYHKSVISLLVKTFGKLAVCITGGTSQSNRMDAVDRFQEDPRIRVMVAQQRAASEGITLTAAKHLAFLEIDWTPSSHTQAEARIHRIGQKGIASVYYLVGAGTIEEKLCRVLQEKQQVVGRLMDRGLGDRLAVYDALITALLPKARKKDHVQKKSHPRNALGSRRERRAHP